MKNYFILLLTVGIFTFSSCSSDDGNEINTGSDRIIGTWKLVQVIPPVIDIEACNEPSMIVFKEDNTANATFYLESNDCEMETSTGNWENMGDDIYEVEVPFAGNEQGSVNFESSDRFIYTSSSVGVELVFERQ